MLILPGKALAKELRNEVRNEINKHGIAPGLAAVLVGDDPASQTYLKLKAQAASEVGINFTRIDLPEDTTKEVLLAKIAELNTRDDIHAIIVQLPLPTHLPQGDITDAIAPQKDVDGFHQENMKLLYEDRPRIVPGLYEGILTLLTKATSELRGLRTLIIAKSDIFADPLRYLLVEHGMLVHTRRPTDTSLFDDLPHMDVIITAVGEPHWLTGAMVRDGVILIDVGTSPKNGKIVGDVNPESLREEIGALSPVPGGVGPLTVAYLMKNALTLALESSALRRINKLIYNSQRKDAE